MKNFIVSNIPNSITCCNLISGAIATVFAVGGNAEAALAFIILGAVFDFFDGMSARLLSVSSPIGKELDSLADDITFGMAPSTIVFSELRVLDYPAFMECTRPWLPFVAFIMAAFSALRLAKFNLDSRQALGFIGLPTPANALFWGSLIVGAGSWMEQSSITVLLMIAMVLVSSWLLVAEIPMFALKFKTWDFRSNRVKYIFLITCVPLIVIFGISAFAIIIAWYVVLSAWVNHNNSKAEQA